MLAILNPIQLRTAWITSNTFPESSCEGFFPKKNYKNHLHNTSYLQHLHIHHLTTSSTSSTSSTSPIYTNYINYIIYIINIIYIYIHYVSSTEYSGVITRCYSKVLTQESILRNTYSGVHTQSYYSGVYTQE